jgi:CRISPR type IV-associated protein Csf3
MFKPLKIIFNLVSPAVPSDNGLLHLDGILSYAVLQDELKRTPNSQGRSYEDMCANLKNILDVEKKGNESVYKASCIQFIETDPIYAGTQLCFIRRTSIDKIAEAKHNFDQNGQSSLSSDEYHPGSMLADITSRGEYKSMRADKINLKSGKYRNYTLFYPSVFAKKAVGYCVGDKEEIERLCNQYIKYIGRKGGSGAGVVSSLTVEVDEAAHDEWEMRAFPWEVPNYAPMQGNASNPYWDVSKNRTVWVPVNV